MSWAWWWSCDCCEPCSYLLGTGSYLLLVEPSSTSPVVVVTGGFGVGVLLSKDNGSPGDPLLGTGPMNVEYEWPFIVATPCAIIDEFTKSKWNETKETKINHKIIELKKIMIKTQKNEEIAKFWPTFESTEFFCILVFQQNVNSRVQFTVEIFNFVRKVQCALSIRLWTKRMFGWVCEVEPLTLKRWVIKQISRT